MNNSYQADENLLSASHPNTTKHTSVYSIIVSTILILLGLAAVLFTLNMKETSSISAMALLTVGVILLLVAIYRLFWRSKELVYIPTGSPIVEGSSFLDVCDLQDMADVLNQGSFDTPQHLPLKMSGNARMDYLISKDSEFAAVQLYHFVPYTYEPASRIYYFTGQDAARFIHRLNAQKF